MPVPPIGLVVGPHAPAPSGFHAAFAACRDVGGKVYQFATRGERRGAPSRGLPPVEPLRQAREVWQGLGFLPPIAHAPADLDLAASDRAARQAALESLRIDCWIAREAGARTVVVHAGRGPVRDAPGAVAALSDSLNRAVALHGDLTFLVELRFGVSGEFGRRLEDLARVWERLHSPDRVGLCLDVAHGVWAGELVPERADRFLARIDHLFGSGALRLCHLNDAYYPARSRRYLHVPPGTGQIAVPGFRDLLGSRLLEGLPLIIEAKRAPECWPDLVREARRLVAVAEALR